MATGLVPPSNLTSGRGVVSCSPKQPLIDHMIFAIFQLSMFFVNMNFVLQFHDTHFLEPCEIGKKHVWIKLGTWQLNNNTEPFTKGNDRMFQSS